MHYITSLLVAIALLGTSLPASAAVKAEFPEFQQEVMPGSVLVAFEPGTDVKTPVIQEIAERLGVVGTASIDPSGKSPLASTYEFQFDPEIPVADAVRAFSALDGVIYAEPNQIYHPAVAEQTPPNDTFYSASWHLANINAFGGWLVSWGSPTIPIAIIDSGVKWNHPDLAANIWVNADEVAGNGIDDDLNGFVDDIRGWDFVNTFSASCASALGEDCLTQDNNPMDHYGHGTAVAGAAAAVTDNSIGIAGICRTCRIMPLRTGYTIIDPVMGNVIGASLSSSAIANAITYAANNGARVINMSFSGFFSTTIQNAMNFASGLGVVLIAAAGNGNTDVIGANFPGYAANAIGVGATDQMNQKAYMSNFGAWVDVSAPGVSIYTTVPPYAYVGGDPDGDGYCQLDGTSLAAPIIAGVVGMLLAKNPSMTADQVRTMIQSGVDGLATTQHLGTGKTNPYKTMYLGVQGFNPPVALLASTMDNASAAGGPVTVTGTANGANATYKLFVGSGVNPTAWTVVQPATPATVVNGALGTWNPGTLGLVSGTYTLRLEVTKFGKKFIDDTLVTY